MLGRLFSLEEMDTLELAQTTFAILLFSFIIWSIVSKIPEGIKVLYLISGGGLLAYILYERAFKEEEEENNVKKE